MLPCGEYDAGSPSRRGRVVVPAKTRMRSRREVDRYLASVSRSPVGIPVAIIAPHAGLMYSGPIAAHAYRLLRGRASTSLCSSGRLTMSASRASPCTSGARSIRPSGRFRSQKTARGRWHRRCDRGTGTRPRTCASTRSRCSCRFSNACCRRRRSCRCVMGHQRRETAVRSSAMRSRPRSRAGARCSSRAPICRTTRTRASAAKLDERVIQHVQPIRS